MWALRALAQLVFHVLVGVVVAVAVAAVITLVHGGGFRHAFVIACWCIGALLLLMGAVGHTTASRTLETGGRVPGLPATFQSRPGDTSLSSAAVFILTAIVLFGFGVVLR